MYKIERNDVIV